MNKTELIAYAAEVGREDLDETMTKKEILFALQDDGHDEVIEPETEKQDIPADSGDEKIVKMITDASYYSFGPYVFSKTNRFVIMDAESADQIIRLNPDNFVIANTKEVEDFYR